MKEGQGNSKAKRTFRASQPSTSGTGSKSPAKRVAKPKTEPRRAAGKTSGSQGDWRAETLTEIRRLIHEADPEMVEERKWIKPSNPSGVPTWSHAGIVCTGETYKAVVKVTFARG